MLCPSIYNEGMAWRAVSRYALMQRAGRHAVSYCVRVLYKGGVA